MMQVAGKTEDELYDEVVGKVANETARKLRLAGSDAQHVWGLLASVSLAGRETGDRMQRGHLTTSRTLAREAARRWGAEWTLPRVRAALVVLEANDLALNLPNDGVDRRGIWAGPADVNALFGGADHGTGDWGWWTP